MNTKQSESAITRRAFLWTASMCALAGTITAGCSTTRQAGDKNRKIIVGAHPWVYAATQPKFDITPVLPQIFADMSYAGLDGIELMHNALRPDSAVERIGALSQQHHLPVIGASFDGAMWDRKQHANIMADAELVIPRLAKLGGRTLGISVGPLEWGSKKMKTADQLDAQAELLKPLMALCKRHGIVPNLHNHTYEVANDLYDLKGTLARIPGARLGPDLNWLVRGGVDPATFLREYGSRIVFLHLRDQKKDGRWSEALGEGDMDFAAIHAALLDIHFSGDAIIELAHEQDFRTTRPLRESLKISREFVHRTLGY
jgi:sugar phosphate isomerase/epimerase